MDGEASFWLSILGAATGGIGMITGIAAVLYARRQALAAEGPQFPDIEIASAEWDEEYANWYHLHITTRNRTDKSWRMVSAMVRLPKKAKIVSAHQVSSVNQYGNHEVKPLSTIDASSLGSTTSARTNVAPSDTTYSRHSDFAMEQFLLYIPPSSRGDFVSIDFIFEDKAAIARQRCITLKRRLEPRTMIATE